MGDTTGKWRNIEDTFLSCILGSKAGDGPIYKT